MTLVSQDGKGRPHRAARPQPESPLHGALGEMAVSEPTDISEALVCMARALNDFHRVNDYRAVFLHAYYIITRNVYRVIEHQRAGASNGFLFHDPEWMSRLAGRFATLYFVSIDAFERGRYNGAAWELAHRSATDKVSTVTQDLLLGINAHIGYDLAPAICSNILAHGDERSPASLLRRKRDHDQANRILARSIADIWRDIPRAYGGLLRGLDAVTLRADRYLARLALQRYREGVWWHAMDLVEARSEAELERVRVTMDGISTRIAEIIAGRRRPEFGPVLRLGRLARKKDLTSLRHVVQLEGSHE